MTEFSEQYAKLDAAARKEARKALEAEMRIQLTRLYGRVWTRGKIAIETAARPVTETAARAR